MRGESEMTREDIIRMALEAGATEWCPGWHLATEQLARFAALVAAAESESCAQIADEWATREQKQFGNGGPGAAIRARGEK